MQTSLVKSETSWNLTREIIEKWLGPKKDANAELQTVFSYCLCYGLLHKSSDLRLLLPLSCFFASQKQTSPQSTLCHAWQLAHVNRGNFCCFSWAFLLLLFLLHPPTSCFLLPVVHLVFMRALMFRFRLANPLFQRETFAAWLTMAIYSTQSNLLR